MHVLPLLTYVARSPLEGGREGGEKRAPQRARYLPFKKENGEKKRGFAARPPFLNGTQERGRKRQLMRGADPAPKAGGELQKAAAQGDAKSKGALARAFTLAFCGRSCAMLLILQEGAAVAPLRERVRGDRGAVCVGTAQTGSTRRRKRADA